MSNIMISLDTVIFHGSYLKIIQIKNLFSRLIKSTQKINIQIIFSLQNTKLKIMTNLRDIDNLAQMYLQLPLRQGVDCNVYLLALSSWKVNIAENPIAVMGL